MMVYWEDAINSPRAQKMCGSIPVEKSLRNEAEMVGGILSEALGTLWSIEQKLYTPRPCNAEDSLKEPYDESLEGMIARIKKVANELHMVSIKISEKL